MGPFKWINWFIKWIVNGLVKMKNGFFGKWLMGLTSINQIWPK